MKDKGKRQRSGGRMKDIVGTRGRVFRGTVTKKFEKRVVVEFERTVKISKYERFAKKRAKLHARFDEGMDVKVGDFVKIRECRPLSKIIKFKVEEVIRREA